MTLIKKSEGIYIDESILPTILSSDGIIFDCDGVLVDISESYDYTIQKTVQHVLKIFASIDGIKIDSKIIDGFKATGGFNDEVDLTYAAIISLVAAEKLGKDQSEFIFDVIGNADSTGILSVESFLDKMTDISEIKTKLDYPGSHSTNFLYKIFDQLFYGPELYRNLFGVISEFTESGLIENDKVLVTLLLLSKLGQKFHKKMGIVTGRGMESIRYSLKELLDEFDVEHSVFLEDEPREMAKPNPKSLVRTVNGMNCKNIIYVGDSMEDFIMTKKISELGHNVVFCGIIGTSKNPQEKLELFEKNDAVIILDSIDLLPKILNLE